MAELHEITDTEDSNGIIRSSSSSGENQARPATTKKLIKDIKMTIAAMLVLAVILSHYAFIMRQFVLYRDIPWIICISYFAGFGVVTYALGYLLLSVVYPRIYAEEIREIQLGDEKKVQ